MIGLRYLTSGLVMLQQDVLRDMFGHKITVGWEEFILISGSVGRMLLVFHGEARCRWSEAIPAP